jgi:hypothetical protein
MKINITNAIIAFCGVYGGGLIVRLSNDIPIGWDDLLVYAAFSVLAYFLFQWIDRKRANGL